MKRWARLNIHHSSFRVHHFLFLCHEIPNRGVYTTDRGLLVIFHRRRSAEMGRRMIFRFAAVALWCAAWAAAAHAQSFRQRLNLAPGGSITIKNVSGDINISGHDGAAVEVTAYKEERDRDQVSVENLSTPNHVSLRAEYPDH